ncbi:MAG: hypothetical protein Q4D61_07200 [Cardiobacteriaceae bacterium]|nr:hypothetical protein [Cardiobacteriaceae bacterium]
MKKLLLAALIATTSAHAAPPDISELRLGFPQYRQEMAARYEAKHTQAAPATPSDLPLPVYWLDLAVLRDLEPRVQEGNVWQRIMIPPWPLQAYAEWPAVWGEKVGVAADKVRYFIHHANESDSEEHQTLWAFADAKNAEAAFAHLDHEGFAAQPGGAKLLGTPGEFNHAASDNFWRPYGEAVVFALRGDLLWQGHKLPAPLPESWQQIRWQPTLDALRTALPEDAQLLQASFFTLERGMRQDMAEIEHILRPVEQALLENPEADIKKILAQQGLDSPEKIMMVLGLPQDGLPPYLGGVFVDAQHGDKGILLVALIYPDCDTAAKVQAALPARWEKWRKRKEYAQIVNAADDTVAPPQRHEAQGNTYCYAVLRHVSDATNPAEYLAPRIVQSNLLNNDFSVIHIDFEAGQ